MTTPRLPKAMPVVPKAVLERILATVPSVEVPHCEAVTVTVAFSARVTQVGCRERHNEVLARADKAL